MTLKSSWKQTTIIAMDTETTGKYPLESELCEIAAVKWRGGRIVDEYKTLIKPTYLMSDQVIAIHNITNEMVAKAPSIGEVIEDFYSFIKSSVVMAHHAPFDIGFLVIELEKFNLKLPTHPILCSSLLSRKLIPESPNHKLQTLIRFLHIDGGQAHRALDDARACLQIGLKSFRRCGDNKSIEDLITEQGFFIAWKDYSMKTLNENPIYSRIIEAISKKRKILITYDGGSQRGQPRPVFPVGIIRNPRGDFLVANDGKGVYNKRYFIEKITESSFLES